MFNRFTESARKVIAHAKKEAQRLNHDSVDTEHLLLGLIYGSEPAGVAGAVLQKLGLSAQIIRTEVEKSLQPRSQAEGMDDIPFTSRSKKVLEMTAEEARLLGHNYIGTEHILLGLFREPEGLAARVLTDLGADLNKCRNEVKELLGVGNTAYANKYSAIEETKTYLQIKTLEKRIEELEKRVKQLEDSSG